MVVTDDNVAEALFFSVSEEILLFFCAGLKFELEASEFFVVYDSIAPLRVSVGFSLTISFGYKFLLGLFEKNKMKIFGKNKKNEKILKNTLQTG